MTPEELSDILPPHIYMIKENLMNLLCELNNHDCVTPDVRVLEVQFNKMFYLDICEPPRNYRDWNINETILEYIKEALLMEISKHRST